MKFKAGFILFNVKTGDIDSNFSKVKKELEILGKDGVELAVLPEMWSCGFDNERLEKHAEKTPEILKEISEISQKQKMVIAGSMPELSGKGIFNTMYVTDKDGSFAGEYRKIHLFSLTNEDKYYIAGNKNIVCKTSLGPIGLMICYDLRFPELCRALTLKGASVVIVSAQWPFVRIKAWNLFALARAMENQIFLIAANRSGTALAMEFGGHSVIVDPNGDILANAAKEAKTAWAEIDTDRIDKIRKIMPCLKERAPAAYEI